MSSLTSYSSDHQTTGSVGSDLTTSVFKELKEVAFTTASARLVDDKLDIIETSKVLPTSTIDTHDYVDGLIEKFNLTSSQTIELRMLIDHGNSFKQEELMFKLFGIANSFQTQNLISEVLSKYANIEASLIDLQNLARSNEDHYNHLLALFKQVVYDLNPTIYGQMDRHQPCGGPSETSGGIAKQDCKFIPPENSMTEMGSEFPSSPSEQPTPSFKRVFSRDKYFPRAHQKPN